MGWNVDLRQVNDRDHINDWYIEYPGPVLCTVL